MRQSDISEAGPQLGPLAAGEAERLADLWVRAWRRAWTGQSPAIDFGARRDWLLGVLAAPRHRTIVARAPTHPLGFATFEDTYLHQLAVDPDAQGQGIATALLAAVEAATGASIELDVNVDNHTACAFYARRGFAIVATGRNPNSGAATVRLRKAAVLSRP